MSDRDLFDAVARKTGEDSHEIARRGFVLTGPDDAGPEPENLLDALLVDLQPIADAEFGADQPGRVVDGGDELHEIAAFVWGTPRLTFTE